MKNKQKNGKKSYLYIIFLALAFIILLETGAYAYYQTTITGTISGSVAKWSFKANNQTSTFNLDFGSLYPGKEETYYVELSAEDSDLDVYYELVFTSFNSYDVGRFYSNSTHTRLLSLIYNADASGTVGSKYTTIYGLCGLISAGTKITIPLYFYWGYDDDPFISSDSDESLANGDFSYQATIQINSMQSSRIPYEPFDYFPDNSNLEIYCSNGELFAEELM